MKKRFFYTIIVCFALMAQNAVQAETITLSTDTGDGATWYRVKNVRASSGGRAAYIKADGYDAAVILADIEESDAFLWCFVGSSLDNFQVYNKAFLNNDAKLVGVDGDNGAAKLATSSISWTYSWAFKDDGGSYGLLPGSTNGNYLHGTLSTGVIFYGHAATEGGSAWTFEDATIPVVVDFSALNSLITEYTNQVTADKLNATNVEKYGEGITAFEEAIAAAKTVADNSVSTQGEVNAAFDALKKARYAYTLAFIDLPFTISQGDNMVWYKVKNMRRANEGYLTYSNGELETTTSTGSDNQSWAFTGDNFTGINIYNKADMANDAKLIYDEVFTISTSSWDGVWKLDRRISDGSYYYGICNANGRYDGSYTINDFIHGMLDGGTVFYGFGDDGSLWGFEALDPSSIDNASDATVLVYAQDGKIFVKGAEAQAKVTSMTGQTAVFDAATPYSVAVKGIYIVQVNGKAYKVAVQ